VSGIVTIFRKEMEDHFSSTRFLLISAVIVMVGVIIASMVGMGIQEETKGMAKPSLVFLLLFTSTGKLFSFAQFIGFFGPLIGIILGFDAINRERVSRTLSKLVSQPIYRDSIINAKFMTGVAKDMAGQALRSRTFWIGFSIVVLIILLFALFISSGSGA